MYPEPGVTAKPHIRACEVLGSKLPAGAPPLTDREISVTCPKCADVVLSACYLKFSRETIYTCPKCCEALLILAVPNPDETPWMEGAYRLSKYVIWHAGDLRFRGTVMPRSTERPETVLPAAGKRS